MSTPRSVVLSIVAATATIGLLLLGAPQVASASVTQASGAPSASQAARASFTAAPGGGAAPAAAVSPSLCTQTAQWPHESTHVPGTMNGGISAKCNRVVPEISLTAQMWETRWWGWDRIGKKGSISAFLYTQAIAYANDKCRNSTIRTTGDGFVIDVDNKPYYASTESIHVKNPCHL